MPTEFHDFSVQCKGAIEEAAIRWLYESADELTSQTIRGTSQEFKDFDVKNSWKRVVDDENKKAQVGSDKEAAFWEELGTGEYAVNHDGRRGWWVFVEDEYKHPSRQKVRTQEEAEDTAAFLRSQGLPAHATNGTPPNRPLMRAYESTKDWIINRAKEIFKRLE